MARTYRYNTPRMAKPWMRYSGQYKFRYTARIHADSGRQYYWFGEFNPKNTYLCVRFGFGWRKSYGRHKFMPLRLVDDRNWVFYEANRVRLVFNKISYRLVPSYYGHHDYNHQMKMLHLVEFVSSFPQDHDRFNLYSREGGFARKKFIRRRRMIERNWLKSRDWDDETLYERKKTSGWDTW